MSSQLRISPTLMLFFFFHNRMAAGLDHVLSMPCTFINYLIGTSIRQLIQNMDVGATDFFDYDVVIMPFEEDGQRSLFLVLGAGHIKDYMRCNFRKTRPCILHILPHETSTRAQMHAYNAASSRIRTWLNALWRAKYCEHAYDSMPFTHRSMPTTRPFGMYMVFKNTHILTRRRCFGVMYLTFSLTIFFTFSANPITKNRY